MAFLPFEPDAISMRVHMLDMGERKYGECILCQYQDVSILIDGGHSRDFWPSNGTPSIPQQLEQILGHPPPFNVSLLVVTHCHADHIGCLPRMISEGMLTADWALVADERLGFGRPIEDDGILADPAIPPGVKALAIALREDTRADVDDDELIEFLQDAYYLEDWYDGMLARLEEAGTQIVRHGRDDTAALVQAFSNIGLEILGPSTDQLLICAERIRQMTQDAIDGLMQLPEADYKVEGIVGTYRRLADHPAADAADMRGKGAALNNQSITLKLEAANRKVLLTGDMQFAAPEVDGLDNLMQQFRQDVANEAPYDFVKTAHHSSYNGISEDVYQELAGTARYGHSGGTGSSSHPHRDVLALMRNHRNEIKWCRTDRNGLITVRLSPGGVWIFKERGSLNDFTPNRRDTVVPEAPVQPEPGVFARQTPETTGADDVVEVTARIPRKPTRVDLTIQVKPQDATPRLEPPTREPTSETPSGRRDEPEPFQVGGGRDMPRLLFVTSRDGLARNIGREHADHALASIVHSGQALLDDLPAGAGSTTETRPLVTARLQELETSGSPVGGVVIVGGYDVVPSQRLDTLEPAERAALPSVFDSDRFLVWSDDCYGCNDGDDLAELPVSRIPDGHSAALVIAALKARGRTGDRGRFSVRNAARPFAELVFLNLPGAQPQFVSAPTNWRTIPARSTQADVAYFMLHGAAYDGSSFWGESPPGEPDPEAVTIHNIPAEFRGAVLTGCCWGALCSARPAFRLLPGEHAVGRDAKDSIALSYLQAGATAFVGCTGTHYSPIEEPYGYFGQPMHDEFWSRYLAGTQPARALHEAKIAYLAGIPHGPTSPLAVAIEKKIHRQFTCLGLGW